MHTLAHKLTLIVKNDHLPYLLLHVMTTWHVHIRVFVPLILLCSVRLNKQRYSFHYKEFRMSLLGKGKVGGFSAGTALKLLPERRS